MLKNSGILGTVFEFIGFGIALIYPDQTWIGLLSIFVGLCLFVYWFVFIKTTGWKPFIYGYIPLHEAAKKAYEVTRAKTAAVWSETSGFSYSNNPIGWYAQALLGLDENNPIQLYGCKPNLNFLDLIPYKECKNHQLIADENAASLQDKTKHTISYDRLHIKKSDLKNRINIIETWRTTSIQPDINLCEAIDYLINILFPDKIPSVGNIDIENTRAVNLITEKLRSGELNSWGLYVGESVEREFNQDDWEYRELLPLEASIPTTKDPQTKGVNTNYEQHQLTGIRVNFYQVKKLWPEN